MADHEKKWRPTDLHPWIAGEGDHWSFHCPICGVRESHETFARARVQAEEHEARHA